MRRWPRRPQTLVVGAHIRNLARNAFEVCLRHGDGQAAGRSCVIVGGDREV